MDKAKLRQETIDTYNKSAKGLAEYFKGIGPRVKDIERGLELAGNPSAAKVTEIGCGDGRDAKEIVARVKDYVGFDISSELIKLALAHVPGAKFEVADAVDFSYPAEQDVIFAFASLLHLDKKELKIVFEKAALALKPGGIFYISVKYAPNYQEFIKEDDHGRRLFYLYDEATLTEAAGTSFEQVFLDKKTIGKTEWLEIAFRKK